MSKVFADGTHFKDRNPPDDNGARSKTEPLELKYDAQTVHEALRQASRRRTVRVKSTLP